MPGFSEDKFADTQTSSSYFREVSHGSDVGPRYLMQQVIERCKRILAKKKS